MKLCSFFSDVFLFISYRLMAFFGGPRFYEGITVQKQQMITSTLSAVKSCQFAGADSETTTKMTSWFRTMRSSLILTALTVHCSKNGITSWETLKQRGKRERKCFRREWIGKDFHLRNEDQIEDEDRIIFFFIL